MSSPIAADTENHSPASPAKDNDQTSDHEKEESSKEESEEEEEETTKKTTPKKRAAPKKTASSKKGKSAPKKKKVKKEKDPDAPKRAKNAYMFYAQAMREEAKKNANPKEKINVAEQSKEFGANWKAMSDDEKAPYEKMKEQDKKRYDAEMKTYGGSSNSSSSKKGTNSKKKATAKKKADDHDSGSDKADQDGNGSDEASE